MEAAYFEKIEEQIISHISTSQKRILIAMAWFTNENLFNVLLKKLSERVAVELIIINDDINNRPFGLDFQKFINCGGRLYINNPTKLMHNKFCLIDDAILINGSYNWTYYAETRNFENIIIHSNNISLNKFFLTEFERIKIQCTRLYKYERKLRFNTEADNLNYILFDAKCQAKVTNNGTLLNQAEEVAGKIRNKIGIERGRVKSLRHYIGIGTQNDNFARILNKGAQVPCEGSTQAWTPSDNVDTVTFPIYYGYSNKASKNIKIAETQITGLPLKPKGEVKFHCYFKISNDGILYFKASQIDSLVFAEVTVDCYFLIQ